MCLVLFALDAHPTQRLVVLANRDEFYARPTAPSSWWDDAPGVLAGRDLEAGGTWMGVSRSGRWTAVTNVRDPSSIRTDARSRGDLTRAFLTSDTPPADYASEVFHQHDHYNGFNLLIGDGEQTWIVSSRLPEPRQLEPGLYGLSNDTLDTPWPKVRRGTDGLRQLLRAESFDREAAFSLLADAEPAPDAELPETGVGLAWERALSSPFIQMERYGTRASTVLTVSRDGNVDWTERRHLTDDATSISFGLRGSGTY
ncbi:MAG: NRDE family protein [Rubricoccaceae bacterium]